MFAVSMLPPADPAPSSKWNLTMKRVGFNP